MGSLFCRSSPDGKTLAAGSRNGIQLWHPLPEKFATTYQSNDTATAEKFTGLPLYFEANPVVIDGTESAFRSLERTDPLLQRKALAVGNEKQLPESDAVIDALSNAVSGFQRKKL